MSAARELDAPHTLASLPRPFDSTNGRTVAAGVHSLSGSKKRKRTEIATGVDGEGVNIYSLVTSYALPPHTYFTAAPCSVYRKGSKTRTSQRFTYAPVAQSLAGSDAQVICFTEDVRKGDTNTSKKSTFSIPKGASRVIALEVIPLVGTEENPSLDHDVISIHEGGEVYCFSADLKSTRWVSDAGDLASTQNGKKKSMLIEYVCLTTAKAVRQGLLKSRTDVLTALNPSMGVQEDSLDATHILCLVARDAQLLEDNPRTLQILAIPSRSSDAITSRRLKIQHVLAWDLPSITTTSSSSSQDNPIYSLNSKSGILHQLIHGVIITYDFSGTIPRVSSKLEVPRTSLQSFVQLSSSLLFTSSEKYCGIFDVKYNSLQALCTLTSSDGIPIDSKKRKLSSDFGPGSAPKLLAYFSDIDTVVGLAKGELIGIQLGIETSTARGRKETEALLIDSIGKGLRPKRQKPELPKHSTEPLDKCVADFPDGSQQFQREAKREAKMDKCAKSGNVAEFEKLFGFAVGASAEAPKKSTEPKSLLNEADPASQKLLNGTKTDHLTNGSGVLKSKDKAKTEVTNTSRDEWKLPKSMPDSARHLYRRQATYALGKIFSWAPFANGERYSKSSLAVTSSIVISFYPPKVFRWLLQGGHLTKQLIERALREQSSHELKEIKSIADGDLVAAIFNFDPKLQTLRFVLSQPTFLPIAEVVQAVKILIQSFDDDRAPQSTPRLLTNGATSNDDENGMDIDFEIEIEAATQALDHAQSLLEEDNLATRGQAFQHALTRLHSFPPPLITSTLRDNLTHHEIGIFTSLLQIQLHNGGWSSYYMESDSHERTGELYDHSIVIIVALLTCALDAIGISGWLAAANAPNMEDSTANLLETLSQEVTDTLTGVWETLCLKGFVSDFLRHAWRSDRRESERREYMARKEHKPILVPRRDDEDPDVMLQENMLPLGPGKPALQGTKIGSNGVVEVRSKREMGALISRRVPKYSVERIVI
ncbi:uncharacterized protein BDZ99DRAFT_422682 [Mytilinidion resinicola]|uniref:Uncharacterized protein n=1 Tax=Mytilinidion resinicola TaxID=574789 RepID=A0A6A6YE33_9PEZI|nr:uncharacterized protein BDZ99DRAFT_422682 [Mytilinidion resinicola]KAF2806264.1 hypothetical protein BDZ99DRAFT_422682 [Mytilinidion resinicola]